MNGACNGKKLLATPPCALGRGQKVKYLISITKSISKTFIPNFVCVLTNEIQNISDAIFILLPRSCPRGGTLGRCGCPGGQTFFSNIVMWHIKLTGMTSKTECK